MSAFANATTRFSDRVADYACARPGYPPELVPALYAARALQAVNRVVDLGAGTGISAQPFLTEGHPVIGIEPNAAMRAACAPHPLLDLRAGTAEATGLEPHSVDFAFAAQAFHWFDVAAVRAELLRILRPDAHFAAMWNLRPVDATPAHSRYDAILRAHCPDYPALADLYANPTRSAALFGGPWQTLRLPQAQSFARPLFLAAVRSASYVPKPDAAGAAGFWQEIGEFFDQHAVDGQLDLRLETVVHLGRLRGQPAVRPQGTVRTGNGAVATRSTRPS